jgi:hypothetical protein
MKKLLLLAVVSLAGCATVPGPAPVAAPATHSPASSAESAAVGIVPNEASAPESASILGSATVPPATEPAEDKPPLKFKDFVALNDNKLIDVYRGMDKKQVEALMNDHASGRFANPYKRQVVKTREGRSYEILFYLTHAPAAGKPITENHTTPVIFLEGKVDAIGKYPLKKLRRQAAVKTAANHH